MSMQHFLINDYIKKNNSSIDILKTNLYNIGILTKDYEDEGLLLLYNRFDSKNKSPLEQECRSIILNRTTFDLVCFTCNSLISNFNALNYLLNKSSSDKEIFKCYEGSLMSVFNFNNKWYLSSRRCLDSKKSIINEKSHYDMFLEVLNEDKYETFEEFCENLNPQNCYYFVLIHHQNDHNVNYNDEFGENYKKLCLAFVRNQKSQEEIKIDENVFENSIISKNIFLPIKLNDLSSFDDENKKYDLLEKPKTEGIIIKIDGKYLKLQYLNYQFYKAIGPNKNIYRGFIHLYQNNKLSDCFDNNQNFENYKKVVNPLNTNESYDTKGVVDAVFKALTSELTELYKLLWDISGEHKNMDLYNLLPKEYKNILFGIRGDYFKRKKNNDTLKLKNIYNYLKSIPSDDIENLIKVRKLMLNWVKLEQNNIALQLFKQISSKCDKVQFKLIAIYTNKLFPEIMPDDKPN